MQALVKTEFGPEHVELQDRPIPTPGAGEVLIKVRFCGICGSDLKMLHGKHKVYPPVVMGHEFAGEIVSLGESVTGWAVGDRVVCEVHNQFCGACRYCRSGQIQLCLHKRPAGWGVDGGFAEFVKMPAFLLHRVPESLSLEEAALVEPTGIGAQTFLKSGAGVEDTVLVIGCGPIGLQAAQVAQAAGCRVIITGIQGDEERLALAASLGIGHPLNLSVEDGPKVIAEWTDGYGPDAVLECSGSTPGIQMAIDAVRRMGTIVAVGLTGRDEVPIPWDKAVMKCCRLEWHFSAQSCTWDKVLGLFAAGKVKARPLISAIAPLSRWREMFEKMERREAIKILLTPGD